MNSQTVIPYLRAILKSLQLKSEWNVNNCHYLDIYVHMSQISENSTNIPVSNWDVHFYSKYLASHRFIHGLLAAFTEAQSVSFFLSCCKKPYLLHTYSIKTTVFHVYSEYGCDIFFRQWTYYEIKIWDKIKFI